MTAATATIPRLCLIRASGTHLMPANQHHLALAPAGPAPRRIASEPEAIHQARVAAVRRLGTNWTLHPAYQFQARHSNSPEVYGPARAAHLAEVQRLAQAARERNPAWRRAQAVHAAVTAPGAA